MPPEPKDSVGTPKRLKPTHAADVAASDTGIQAEPAKLDSAQAKTESPRVDMADLKRKSVRGGAVTMGSQGVSIAIQLTSTVILARLLSPEDYGVMAMVMAIVSFAGLFRDLGLSAAAIQKKDLTRAQQSNLFWLNVGMGTLLTLLVAAASPLVVWFYGKPELLWVTVALSFGFLIGSLSTQHGAMLVRNMQFGRNAIANISGSIVTLVTAVTLALQGFSYWALVWGNLAGGVVITVLLFILSPFRPGLMARNTGIREMLKFGANITAFDFINYFHRNLDNILIGKYWGSVSLGLYSRAYQLLMFPITAIRGPINAVAFPAMSRLQDQPIDFKNYYCKITNILAFVSMPVTAFLFVASAPLIDLLLGESWAQVSPIFSLLAITSFIQPVASLRGNVMLSCGYGKRYLTWGIFNAICISIGFIIGIRWGAVGIAASYAIVNYAILYPSLILAFKDTPLRPADFFRPIYIPVVASLTSVSLTVILQRIIGLQSLNSAVNLLFLASVFWSSYLIVMLIIPGGKGTLSQLIALLQSSHQKPA